MMSVFVLAIASTLLVALTVGMVCTWLWPQSLPLAPQTGERGEQRTRAIEQSAAFKALEPIIRALAASIAAWPIDILRQRALSALKKAGYPLGFDANELVAAALVCAVVGGTMGVLLSVSLGTKMITGILLGAVLGWAIPWFRTGQIGAQRWATIYRGLPAAIDLAALSMNAGLDFQGAIRQVVSYLEKKNPLRFELEHLLRRLSLGWSREDAIWEIAKRVPLPAIKQFASAVSQAEKRGTPLARVLTTQAEVMRTQRSRTVEQAAARAAVLILGPLMLIFICVFIIILGPFVIRYMRGELFQ